MGPLAHGTGVARNPRPRIERASRRPPPAASYRASRERWRRLQG